LGEESSGATSRVRPICRVRVVSPFPPIVLADIRAEGDIRFRYSRFKEEHMKHNVAIVEVLDAMAKNKGITVAQLCIAWVASQGPSVIPLPGSSYALFRIPLLFF
jgi:aryl-alcohol dehydrogenase-like predicted oxidoreductase